MNCWVCASIPAMLAAPSLAICVPRLRVGAAAPSGDSSTTTTTSSSNGDSAAIALAASSAIFLTRFSWACVLRAVAMGEIL